MANCGEYYTTEVGYDPRGSGTTHYFSTCKKCGKGVKHTDDFKVDISKLLKERACPSTEVARKKRKLQLELEYHEKEVARVRKEYLQLLKEHG
jgi:hypothetical protein